MPRVHVYMYVVHGTMVPQIDVSIMLQTIRACVMFPTRGEGGGARKHVLECHCSEDSLRTCEYQKRMLCMIFL